MITVSPGHYGPGTGAGDIIDEVTEAIKVTKKIISFLRAAGIVMNYIEDNSSKSQGANINWLVVQHNKTSRQLDVSVHFNKIGARTDKVFGVEVLYMGDANKALSERVSLAISKASGLKNRGAKKRTDLGLLHGTNKPCILIEVCFVESTVDVALYKAHFDEICTAIARELAAYVGKSLKVTTPAEQKPILRHLNINSQALADVADVILASKAQREIIVNAAVANGSHKAWHDKLKNRTITDDEILALAAKAVVDGHKIKTQPLRF